MERGVIEPQEASEIDVFIATDSGINWVEHTDSTHYAASRFSHIAVYFSPLWPWTWIMNFTKNSFVNDLRIREVLKFPPLQSDLNFKRDVKVSTTGNPLRF